MKGRLVSNEDAHRAHIYSVLDRAVRLDDPGQLDQLADQVLGLPSFCIPEPGTLSTAFSENWMPEFSVVRSLGYEIIRTHKEKPCANPSCALHNGAKERLDGTTLYLWSTAALEASSKDTESSSPQILLSAAIDPWARIVAHTILSAFIPSLCPQSNPRLDPLSFDAYAARMSEMNWRFNLFDFASWDLTDDRLILPLSFLTSSPISESEFLSAAADVIARGFMSFIFAHELSHVLHADPSWINPDGFIREYTDNGLLMDEDRRESWKIAIREIEKIQGSSDPDISFLMALNFSRHQAYEIHADYTAFAVIEAITKHSKLHKRPDILGENQYITLFEIGACAVLPFLTNFETWKEILKDPDWTADSLNTEFRWARDLLHGVDHPHPINRANSSLSRLAKIASRREAAHRYSVFHRIASQVFGCAWAEFTEQGRFERTLQSFRSGECPIVEKWTRDLSDENALGLRERSPKRYRVLVDALGQRVLGRERHGKP